MKKSLKVIYLSVVGICLIVVSIIIGMKIEKASSRVLIVDQVQNSNDPLVSEIKTYKNEALDFSIRYPSVYKSIQEDSNSVTFRVNPEDMWGFSVSTEKVSYNSTKDWLAAQPKGNAQGPGFEGVLWIDHFGASDDGTLLVNEYMQMDSDNGKPIYGKIIYGVRVKDGVLYKTLSKNESRADEPSWIDSEMMDVISSFQLLK